MEPAREIRTQWRRIAGIASRIAGGHVGERIEKAGDRWLAEAQTVARTARLIVNGDPAWRVADKGSDGPARSARYSDI